MSSQPALTQAQRWLGQERPWIDKQQLEFCRIPAPTFFEQARAEWFRQHLESFGWTARLDRVGNVVASFRNSRPEQSVVISAHLDTVLAPARPEDIAVAADGRLTGPGTSDNGAGLSALIALARLFSEMPSLHRLASSLLLVANVGEEGEGNLSGMRYLCRQSITLENTAAVIVLDGPSVDHITAQALSSRRFEVSFSGPGGHSWNDYGTPNPVHALAGVVNGFTQTARDRCLSMRRSRCSYNFGIIEGGASINSIPDSALAKLDLRSEEPAILEEFSGLLTSAVEAALERENRNARNARLAAKIKELGARPGGKLPPKSPLLLTIQAIDSYLNIRSRVDCASTDANIPLSLGLPAISIGAGGQGGGAHSANEWYQPEGRELGLRRILLLIAALAENIGVSGRSGSASSTAS
jgi:acetylornithine deacetylase/succinyl-diaminopimelate desuccinylase-like protein